MKAENHDDRPRRRSRRAILVRWGLLVGLLLFVVWQGLGYAVARHYLNRDYHRLTPVEGPADRGLTAVDVRIPVPDSGNPPLQLAAWFLPADPEATTYRGGAVVLMLHGFGSSRAKIWEDASIGYRGSMFDQGAESLHQAGFHVLMLDFRNHGDSGDLGEVTLGYRETEDALAALDFIATDLEKLGEWEIDSRRIGVRGSSMGGVTGVLAAAGGGRERIAALWADSAFSHADQAISDFLNFFEVPSVLMPAVQFWLGQLTGVEMDQVVPVAGIGQIRCPTMLVHSADDHMIPVGHFERYERAAADLPKIETWRVSGVEHNRLWSVPGYLERQTGFFSRHLAE